MDIIKKLEKLGFSEVEAMVYIELLANPGQNGTQISKKIPLSRTAIYKALETLNNKEIIILIPSEMDNKNYIAKEPRIVMEKIITEYKNILENISYDLQKIYEPHNFYEVFNIVGLDNILAKLKYIIMEANDNIKISGYIKEKYILDNIKVKSIRINEYDDKEFYCIVDDKSILIANFNNIYPTAIYTKNSIIINKYK